MDNSDASSQASSDTHDSSEHSSEEEEEESDHSSEENESDEDDTDSEDTDDDEDEENYHAKDASRIPTMAPKLEKMASVSMAIALWNHATVLFPEIEPDRVEWRRWLIGQVPQWLEPLQLPKSFAKYVLSHFNDIVLQVDHWIVYHYRDVFRYRFQKSDLHRYIYCINWYSNGAINYCQTAKNMLKSDKLANVEKYRLSCHFCLKEEVEKWWKTLAGDRVVEFDVSDIQSVISYWNCYCADKLSEVPADDDQSIEEFLIRRDEVKNWPAIEYFFDRMDADKQVLSAVYFIDKGHAEFQKLLLTKMNESQRLRIYAEKAVQIIENYAKEGGVEVNEPDAISAWFEVRDLITEDQFVSLFKHLCREKASNCVLAEIWAEASDQFKSHILKRPNYDFINEVLKWAFAKSDCELDFLFAVLANGARIALNPPSNLTTKRKKSFDKLCEKLILKVDLESASRLLNFCIPDAEKCTEFKRSLAAKKSFVDNSCKKFVIKYDFVKLKRFLGFLYPANMPESRQIVHDLLLKNLMYIDNYCVSFYKNGNVNGLNTLLAPLQSSYPEVILDFKKYLLFSDEGMDTIYNHFSSTTDVLSEIVADSLPSTKVATEFRSIFFFSNDGIEKLYNLIRDKSFPNVVVKRNVNLFFKSKKDKIRLKTKLISCLSDEEMRADPKAKKKYLQVLSECGF